VRGYALIRKASGVRFLAGAFFLLVALFVASQFSFCQAGPVFQPGLAPTPPMGWASWNHFFCDYTDRTIRDQADALVSSGMRDLGYRYVLIQECIAPQRDANGDLVVDAKRFPHGMKDLVGYIHSRGLEAGIYTDIGANTCAGKPFQGSYEHELQDAQTFAAWGVDLVEMDYCNQPAGVTGRSIYERMAAAIKETGRPMLFYLCSWGEESPWTWAQGKAQLWRTTGDISLVRNHADWANVVRNFEMNATHSVFNAPGSWNDADMLEVGNQGLTVAEAQSHFSMWAVSAAPLWAGNNLTGMSDSIRGIYSNAEAIAIDQDPLGAGPSRIQKHDGGIEVWMKPLGAAGSGVEAVLLLNLAAAPAEASVQWNDLGLAGNVAVRNLWTHKNLGKFRDGYGTKIPGHGSVLLKVNGEFLWSKGATYQAEWPGNVRAGDAALIACPQCNEGYAVSLRGASHGPGASSLTFTHVGVPRSGRYWISLVYVYDGPQEKNVQLQVNGGRPADIHLPAQSAFSPSTKIPVELIKGDNSIAIGFSGEGGVDVDQLTLTQ
jgi:alpha-galactosidase